jgi:hypothetical protein
MSFTLSVNFEELCAFAPEKPFFDPEGPPQQTHVLLRDLRTEPADWDPEETFFEHYAHVEFDSRDRVELTGDNLGVPDATRDDLHLYYFAGEQVEILPNARTGVTTGFRPDVTVPMDPGSPACGEEGSLWWLLKMGDLNQEAERLRPELLDDPPEGPALSARFLVADGELSAGVLTDDLWAVGNDERKIAKRVVLEIDGIDDYVDLAMTGLGGTGQRTLRLRPREGESEVTIFVRNSETGLFFGDVGEGPYGEFDSRIYYALSSALALPLEQQAVPFPSNPPEGGHGSCVPMAFSSVADEVEP